ncbi:MAG: hypothetical protein IT382_15725 [Deltaproteobacteria bacterium]|nr:hypothetical protein [Deltaproteobacteria bacterium]
MRRALVGLVLLCVPLACEARAWLAQSDLFASLRPALIEECCLCLARRGTMHPGASCAEAVLGPDGGVVVPGNEPVIPPDAGFDGDDLDDVLDEGVDGGLGEIPCLCQGNAATCQQALGEGTSIVVTGACITQGAEVVIEAPCETACAGVLTFDPLVAPPSGE